MRRILVVTASPRGTASISTRIVDAVVDGLVSVQPTVEVDRWDLWSAPVSAFGADEVDAKMSVMRGEEPAGVAHAAWQRIADTFARVNAADLYIFGVPMWNGGVPWVLKHWIDTITQPGLLFRFDPATGYRGLLRDKRAAVVYTSSVYQPGVDPAFGVDHHSTYFEAWLHFAGINDIRTVRLQPTHPASAGYAEREHAALAIGRRIGALLGEPDPHMQPGGAAAKQDGGQCDLGLG